MISFLKKNRILSFLMILSILAIIVGLFIPSIISVEDKLSITSNVLQLQEEIKNHHLLYPKTILLSSSLYMALVWILGISIIGIPIILFIYILKILLLSLEIIFLLSNIRKLSITILLLYLLPNIFNVLLFFVLIYYAIQYSLFLVHLLFFKQKYNISFITKRYLKILLILLIINLLNSLIEVYLIPLIIQFFI